jgi:uroporphyrin-III C-methyltransferase / precorrin-2 dehydrogenase / sirohydrochlorin ferrochelatase
MPEAALYPVFLKLAGRIVLVVGAGPVAERKIESLVVAAADVRVVAPAATDRVQALARDGAVGWAPRPFRESDLDGVWLAVAATSDPDVQQAVAASARARRIFVVAVDDPANASAYSGAVLHRPPLLVAISSSGETPALTRLLREVIEHALPSEEWIARARVLRRKWRAEKAPMGGRFAELLRELAALGRTGKNE